MCLASRHKYAESCLAQLGRALDYMIRELEFRSPPLPELLCKGACAARGPVADILRESGQMLERNGAESPGMCISSSAKFRSLPLEARELMEMLSENLGQFDLQGQILGLTSVRDAVSYCRNQLLEGSAQRLRMYHTLGICTGAALAIILL